MPKSERLFAIFQRSTVFQGPSSGKGLSAGRIMRGTVASNDVLGGGDADQSKRWRGVLRAQRSTEAPDWSHGASSRFISISDLGLLGFFYRFRNASRRRKKKCVRANVCKIFDFFRDERPSKKMSFS